MTALPLTCVVDASVGAKLFLEEKGSDIAEALLKNSVADPLQSLFVPDIFFVECANVLWKRVRPGDYSEHQARWDLADLRSMRFRVVPTGELVESALAIACQYGISVYDACYVALSRDEDIPLLTADHKLVEMLQGAPFQIAVLG